MRIAARASCAPVQTGCLMSMILANARNTRRAPQHPASQRRAGAAHTAPTWPVVIGLMVCAGALLGVTYLLWPQWPGPQAAAQSDPDKLPVSIGNTVFNVPTNAVRVKVQRHSGAAERIDLAFLFPSLEAPGPMPRVTAETALQTKIDIDRIFLSIVAHGDAMSPDERMSAIFPRYLDPAGHINDAGLLVRAFRDGSPYQGEDVITATNADFAARCSRDGATPGMCISEKRIGEADLTFRYPRAWLTNWRLVHDAISKLLKMHKSG